MSDTKIYTIEELKKMNRKDRLEMINKLEFTLAHEKINVRLGKNKQNHKIKEYKQQLARLHTLNQLDQ